MDYIKGIIALGFLVLFTLFFIYHGPELLKNIDGKLADFETLFQSGK
jgi:hypothetical protein